jgi:3-hydroxyacyl-[acyl-carrier-protein] dehydratase
VTDRDVTAPRPDVATAEPKVPFDPALVIPHRAPFLFVSEVTAVDPGRSARGTWHVAPDEWFFAGHFPGRPTLPGVLMVESLAQLGAVAVLLDERFTGKLPLFGGIERARFRRQVTPGETLDLEVALERLSARGGRGKARASVGGATCAEAELLFVVVDAGTVTR